jgi:hypothetical protein
VRTQTLEGRIAARNPSGFARKRVPTAGRVLQAERKEEKRVQSQEMSLHSNKAINIAYLYFNPLYLTDFNLYLLLISFFHSI